MEEKKRKTGETPEEFTVTKSRAQALEDEQRRLWEEESRLVKGIFRCHEPRGGEVTFSFKKYKWDNVIKYTFRDGEQYEIPLAVARHLNEDCNYVQHTNVLGPDGRPTKNTAGKKVSRMNFESLDFWNVNG